MGKQELCRSPSKGNRDGKQKEDSAITGGKRKVISGTLLNDPKEQESFPTILSKGGQIPGFSPQARSAFCKQMPYICITLRLPKLPGSMAKPSE